MDFSAALATNDSAERHRLIHAEIVAHDWLDVVAKRMQHGGWPETATPRVGRVEADQQEVRVQLFIDFIELCPQGCNAYPRRFAETAISELAIDRRSGEFTLRDATHHDAI